MPSPPVSTGTRQVALRDTLPACDPTPSGNDSQAGYDIACDREDFPPTRASTQHNKATVTYRLAPETIALCFGFLSSAECLNASHVSRYWRSVALHDPSPWSDFRIDLNSRHSYSLFQLFLSRSGIKPIACIFEGNRVESAGTAFSDLLRSNMHRFRSLTLKGKHMLCSDFLHRSAPNLESLMLVDTAAFCELFDGQAPRLWNLETRDVVDFPSCSAFENVTHLTIVQFLKHRKFRIEELAGNFPRLESLSIRGGTAWLSLPRRATVLRSPSRLSLWVYATDRALLRFCEAWRKMGCKIIELEVACIYEDTFLARLIDGALDLTVTVLPDAAARIEIGYANGQAVSVSCPLHREHHATVLRVADYMLAKPSCLSKLRSFFMTEAVFAEFVDGEPLLPSLISLRVELHSGLAFPSSLECLCDVQGRLLKSLVVDVRRMRVANSESMFSVMLLLLPTLSPWCPFYARH
ncbi:hypothetical protein AURDEDRAFT_172392 [Auricularia subglabra TFB-10046 SS5]|nr:hypothetical protein AURDEDRAFT_172392 [Auricularia subglabra TFB-10046 SS5]